MLNNSLESNAVSTAYNKAQKGNAQKMTLEQAMKEAQRRANVLQDPFMVLLTRDGDYVVASKFRTGTSHVQTFRPEDDIGQVNARQNEFMKNCPDNYGGNLWDRDDPYPETESDAWFFLESVYEHLSETHGTKDAADELEEVCVKLFDEMSFEEQSKIVKIYPHMRANNAYMRDLISKKGK